MSDAASWSIRPLVAAWEAEPPGDEAVFPLPRIAALHRAGALGRFVAMRPGPLVDELRDTLRAIGGADLSLGRVYEGHVNAVQLVQAYGSPAQQARLAADVAAGRLYGVWNTEPPPGMRIEAASGGRFLLHGAKSFATGAGNLDRMLITAKREDGAKQLVLVDLGDEHARADVSGWRTRGMRATQSGLFDFTGLAIGPQALIGPPDAYEREPRFSAGAWRFTAVQLGAVEALVRHLRTHLVESGKARDPLHRVRFADAVAAARSAGLWVREAARRAEAQQAGAVAFVLMTRGVVEDAGHLVMEAAARSVGTASFFTGGWIDRITRDLGLYLRQPVPDQARERAAAAWLDADPWSDDPWW